MSICVALRIGMGVPVEVFLILEESPLLSNSQLYGYISWRASIANSISKCV